MSKNYFDIAVIGLGAVGSAATYQLSLLGKAVVAFEQFGPLHTSGSYHGDTRITRQALGEGAYYVPLSLRSNEIWRELEKNSGKELFTDCGALITAFGERSTTKGDFFQTTVAAAKEHQISHELLSCADLKDRFPQFLFREDEIGYYEPDAGFLRPERCIAVQQQLAQKAGAVTLFETAVKEIIPHSPEGVRIVTEGETYYASKVVIACGAWIHHFLPASLKMNFSIHRQVLYWFEPQSEYDLYTPDKCPVYIRIGSTQPEEIYGFPSVDGIGGGLKMATENFSEANSVEDVRRDVTAEETQEAFRILSQYMKLKPDCVRNVSCIYTSTPDHDFAIDFLPDFSQCLLLSPCSGHGFKHSAAIGELAAQIITSGNPSIELAPFSLSRFSS